MIKSVENVLKLHLKAEMFVRGKCLYPVLQSFVHASAEKLCLFMIARLECDNELLMITVVSEIILR